MKKESINKKIPLPVYDPQKVWNEFGPICKSYKLTEQQLASLILGDWLTTFYLAQLDSHPDRDAMDDGPMLSFLDGASKRFFKYKEYVDASKKDSDSPVCE